MRAEDGSLGSTDARVRRRPTDVLEAEVFWMVTAAADVVEDWPYAGTDFTRDPDLPLLEGDDWDEELGMTSLFDFYVL